MLVPKMLIKLPMHVSLHYLYISARQMEGTQSQSNWRWDPSLMLEEESPGEPPALTSCEVVDSGTDILQCQIRLVVWLP
jgi:hypothetical protein